MTHSPSTPPPASGSAAEPTKLGGAGRRLTLVDVVAQSVGFMGPVFSIAFLVPLVMGIISATGNGAGVAAPLSILIAAIGVLAIAWIVAEYAKRIQAAGALYDYVTDGLGEKLGAAAGFLYYLGVLVLGSGLLVLIAGTIHDTLASEFQFTGIPITGWAIILLVFVGAIMYFGVALSTRFQLVLALLSVATVLLFSIYVIIKVGSGNQVATAFNPSSAPGGWSGIAFGIVYGVLLFIGFETAANLGEETEHPKRDIPRGVIVSVLVALAFYVICAYAQIAGYGFDLENIGKNAGAPLFGLAAPSDAGGFGSVGISRLLELVVILDMLAVLIGISVASSRGIFAMSRDHRFPSILGRVSGRGTPLNASAVVLVVFAIWVVLTRQFTGLFAIPGYPHYFAMFSWGSSFGALALAVIYLLLCIGALRGLRDHVSFASVVLAAVVGIAVTAAAIFGAIYQVPAPTIWAAWAVAGAFVLGLVLAYVAKGPQTAHTSFDELPPAERGPVKL
jgi:amino acid transporter